MKRILCMVVMLSVAGAGAVAETAHDTDQEAEQLYIEALELLIDGRQDRAAAVFTRIVQEYPESPYADRAAQRAAELEGRYDTSGLLGFYIGNLATAAHLTTGIPIVLELGTVATGTAGIVGIGGGLAATYYLTQNSNMSRGQQLWIDSVQAASMISYYLGYSILQDLEVIDYDSSDGFPSTSFKRLWTGSMLTAVGSRAVTYVVLRDEIPPAGRPAAFLTGYSWSNVYLIMGMYGLFRVSPSTTTKIIHLGVPLSSGLLSAIAWDWSGWSAARVGMLSVGGAGGMLIGGFATAVLSPLDLPFEVYMANLIGFTALGQIAAGRFTRNFDTDPSWDGVGLQVLPSLRIASDLPADSTGDPAAVGDTTRLVPGVEVVLRY
ncbi:hypothetical protein [Spirochaeta africana]|uniref:Tetratricopeptide repeat protein n=1 Tax=Spirochaeta africana (strain ATCC 700263 / DSM 8902 / Z-7692) TaxID=889378 RepID=H9UK03_SPIAZ|nr:hypothetical protein [Spirochaeta africana]AFG37846.1 hypothetical protein Spiaf_1789 [Spirochaeta africana DSM 8902]